MFKHLSNKFDVSSSFFKLMICFKTLLRSYEKNSSPKKLKNKKPEVASMTKEICFGA
jgi:hypothetical protein